MPSELRLVEAAVELPVALKFLPAANHLVEIRIGDTVAPLIDILAQRVFLDQLLAHLLTQRFLAAKGLRYGATEQSRQALTVTRIGLIEFASSDFLAVDGGRRGHPAAPQVGVNPPQSKRNAD